MLKVLFDTNIILDWILEREKFYKYSSICIQLCKDSKIQGYLTPHSMSDIFYLVRKEKGLSAAKEFINLLMNIFCILTEDEKTFISIVESSFWKEGIWNDIEDSLQMTAAQLSKMDLILTRDSKDYKYSSVKQLSPEDYFNDFCGKKSLIK